MSIKATLTCINAVISQQDWQECLANTANDVNKLTDCKSKELIIISLPYSLNYIKQTIEAITSTNFTKDCFDIITDYIIPNKKYIEEILISNNINNIKNTNNSFTINKWTSKKHDQLIATQSFIIINTKTAEFQSIPRNVIALTPQHNKNWQIFWHRSLKNTCITQIFSVIGHGIANKYLSKHFELYGDWSQKTDFFDAITIRYICDNGKIAQGNVLRQNSYTNKIFVHFNTDAGAYGSKYAWISIPNERICSPKPKQGKSKTDTRPLNELTTFYASNSKERRRRNDPELQKAIAASLQHSYGIEGVSSVSNNYYTQQRNEDEELRKAIAASLGEEYRLDSGNNNNDLNEENVNNGVVEERNNNQYFDFENEDDMLQRAIAESLRQ